ncbi:unnamed protein product [Rhizophagus irregularis]|nr:unnamed protein product [Rhizophagus irregularis]
MEEGDFAKRNQDSLPIFGKGETKIRSGGLSSSEERKTKDSFGELPTNGNQDSFGGLLTNGEPRFVRCLGRASEEWKNLKIRSGGLPKNGKWRTKVRFGWASNLRIKWNQDSSRNGLVVLPGQSFEE